MIVTNLLGTKSFLIKYFNGLTALSQAVDILLVLMLPYHKQLIFC
jgi:hypothetical protein